MSSLDVSKWPSNTPFTIRLGGATTCCGAPSSVIDVVGRRTRLEEAGARSAACTEKGVRSHAPFREYWISVP